MTLKNNSLSDHLNDFKNKSKEVPKNDLNEILPKRNPLVDFLNSLTALITLILKALIFGYSLKIIFKEDWNFWAIMCIGLSVTFIFTYIEQLFRHTKI